MQYTSEAILKDIKKLTKISDYNSRISYILDEYTNNPIYFHRVFLHSCIAFGLEKNDFEKILSLDCLKKNTILWYQLVFLKDKLFIFHELLIELKLELAKCDFNTMLEFIEILSNRQESQNIGFDGKKYSSKILNSQYSFFTGHYYDILIEFSSSCLGQANDITLEYCQKIFEQILNLYSIKEHIFSVCFERRIPMPCEIYMKNNSLQISWNNCGTIYSFESENRGMVIKEIEVENFNKAKPFFLFDSDGSKKPNEIYRDLNIKYLQNFKSDNKHISTTVMHELIRRQIKGDILYLNMQFVEDQIALITELNELFDIDTTFRYNGVTYNILMLVDIAIKIQNINFELIEHKIFQYEALKKVLLVTDMEADLLSLYIFKLKQSTKKIDQHKPIFNLDKDYYILPSRVKSVDFSILIDSILSRPDIEKTLSLPKGFNFENKLRDMIKGLGYKYFSLNKNELPGCDEIDGIFEYKGDFFIYEAKASILPISIFESYNQLNSVMYKAYKQLEKRMNWLLLNCRVIEEKFSISLDQKKIYPLIISNHATFTGYELFKIETTNQQIGIIDYESLKYILTHNKILEWNSNNQNSRYSKKKIPLKSAANLYQYISKPYSFLKSVEPPTVQFQKYGICFFIVQEHIIE